MAGNCPKIFIVIILCIVLVFISGLLLPRYLSKQYLQLRNELDSEGRNLKYSQRENLKHFETSLNLQNKSGYPARTIRSVRKTENVHEDSSIIRSLNDPSKVKKRSKRHALSDKDKILSWNFSLNVFSHQNFNSLEADKEVFASDQKSFKGVALDAKGEGKQYEALAELQNALNSAKQFINNFIFKTQVNVTRRENIEFSPEKVEFVTKFHEQTVNPNTKLERDENEDEPINARRQGKFIFGMFGFGKKSIESTTNFEEETLITTKRDTDMGVLKLPEEVLESAQSPQTNPENDPEILNLQTESFVMQTTNFEIESDEVVNNTEFSLRGITEHESSDNITDGIEPLAQTETDFKETSEANVSSNKPLFSDNVLELFCMRLVSKVEETQHSFDSDEGNGLNVQHSKQNEHNQLRSSQNSSFLNLLSVFNSVQKEQSTKDPDAVKDFVSISNDELVSEIELSKEGESRFVNLGSIFESGSGSRSAISIKSNNLENTENEDVVKLDNLPSFLDCENYFREKNIKMFPKPNLMDMISDPKIQLIDFANASISSNLQEKNLQFLTDLFKSNLNNTVDTFSKKSKDANIAKLNSGKDLIRNKDSLNVVDTVEILNANESRNSQLSKPISTTSGVEEVVHSTESQRAGKFINFSDLGNLFFGSGMRSLETLDSTEPDNTEIFASGEQFRETDEQLRIFKENVSQERIFGFFGSGDGRELFEDVKTTEMGVSCDQDCIQGITEKSDDCDDNASSLENSFEHNGFENFEDAILKNKSNCEEDCFTNTMEDGKSENAVRNVSVDEILNENKNLEEHLNCSCYHQTSDSNITFPECDECNFGDVQQNNEFNAPLDQQSVVIRNESEVKFQGDYENDCYDCNTEEKLPNFIFTSKNTSFLECDECTFSSINESKHESAEKSSLKNTDGHNITFQECDECSFSAQNEQEIHKNTENLSHEDNLSQDIGTMIYDYGTDCDDCNDAHINQSNDGILYLDSLNGSIHTQLINADSTDHEKWNERTDVDNTTNEAVESFTDVNQIQKVVNEQTTEIQPRRFMETIFLTGSGDGGLFGDSVGPINLIEEESTVVLPEFSRKKGRAEDTLSYSTEMWNESDLMDLPRDTTNVPQISTSVPSNTLFQKRGRLNDISINSFDVLNGTNQEDLKILKDKANVNQKEIISVSENVSPRRGKLDDAKFDLEESNWKNSSNTNEDASTTSKTSKFRAPEKTDSAILPKGKSNITNITITELPLDTFTTGVPILPPRFCSSASDCSGALNERCLTVNSVPICTCGRAYLRDKVTRKCILKRIVNTSMKLPAEKFDDDLKDPSSQRYKEMKKYAIDWMSSLLRSMRNLGPILPYVDVVQFSRGSVIVHWNIVFVVENESEENFIKDVTDGFQKALQNESLRQEGPLNVSNASLISVNSVDPCKEGKLNECFCKWEAVPEGFTCQCSEQFRDYSHHIEETCEESCSPDFCSFNGHCEIVDNKRICLCSGLYFGRRCDVSGLYILIICGIIAVISVALLFIMIFGMKFQRRSDRRSQTFRRSQEVGSRSQTHDRVSDTIAMEENFGATVSKFAPITTPTQLPVIKVIKPTVSGSLTSFEYDCQFDSSPSEVVFSSGTTIV